MTTPPAPHHGPARRRRTHARLNAAFLATGAETGSWDDHGIPAPWPDDIEDWTPATRPHGEEPYDF